MGEVYRAEDTKLGREVAIKVLPEAVAGDPERLARFEREAKVLASLNHPNIAGIHQVEEAAGVHFLVMELAEGEDLKELLARGPIPVGNALSIGLQIAEALEDAQSAITAWAKDYNESRPHTSLGALAPQAYVAELLAGEAFEEAV